MDLLKLKQEKNKITYSIRTDFNKIVSISRDDIKAIENLFVENDENKRKHFRIDIETSKGKYSFENAEEIEYQKLLDEKIIKMYFAIHIFDDDNYLYTNLDLRNKFYSSVSVESSNEIYTRGLYEKIVTYLSKNETWYSSTLNVLNKYEILCFLLVTFAIPLIEYFHSLGMQYRYLCGIFGIFTIILIIHHVHKIYAPKTIFILEKSKNKFTNYFKNQQFWEHVINTTITIIFTSIANYIFIKH